MKQAGIRAVLFDAGNTLTHLDYDFIAELLAEHGCAATPLDIRRAEYGAKAAIDRALVPHVVPAGSVEGMLWPDNRDPRPSYFAILLEGLGVAPDTATQLLDLLQEHNRRTCLWRVVAFDTAAVLETLRARGFTLAVISNADGRIEGDLERYGLRQHFATVVDSHVVGVEKPDPAIFALTLDRLGVAPAAAVYIGDVFGIDVMGARRAGLHAVLFDALGCYPISVDCPRVRRLGDLLDLLPERARPSQPAAGG